jgi:predicted transcriptional regulator YdeE
MGLNEHPEVVTWPETHYVFVEKIGSFMENAPKAWQEAHRLAQGLRENNNITGYMAMYKMGPGIYRAGFSIGGPPVKLPDGLKYEKFNGGKYVGFELTGPYEQLPKVTGRAWEIIGEKKIELRDDFAIENYVNDPNVTPAEKLITHILIPTV